MMLNLRGHSDGRSVFIRAVCVFLIVLIPLWAFAQSARIESSTPSEGGGAATGTTAKNFSVIGQTSPAIGNPTDTPDDHAKDHSGFIYVKHDTMRMHATMGTPTFSGGNIILTWGPTSDDVSQALPLEVGGNIQGYDPAELTHPVNRGWGWQNGVLQYQWTNSGVPLNPSSWVNIAVADSVSPEGGVPWPVGCDKDHYFRVLLKDKAGNDEFDWIDGDYAWPHGDYYQIMTSYSSLQLTLETDPPDQWRDIDAENFITLDYTLNGLPVHEELVAEGPATLLQICADQGTNITLSAYSYESSTTEPYQTRWINHGTRQWVAGATGSDIATYTKEHYVLTEFWDIINDVGIITANPPASPNFSLNGGGDHGWFTHGSIVTMECDSTLGPNLLAPAPENNRRFAFAYWSEPVPIDVADSNRATDGGGSIVAGSLTAPVTVRGYYYEQWHFDMVNLGIHWNGTALEPMPYEEPPSPWDNTLINFVFYGSGPGDPSWWGNNGWINTGADFDIQVHYPDRAESLGVFFEDFVWTTWLGLPGPGWVHSATPLDTTYYYREIRDFAADRISDHWRSDATYWLYKVKLWVTPEYSSADYHDGPNPNPINNDTGNWYILDTTLTCIVSNPAPEGDGIRYRCEGYVVRNYDQYGGLFTSRCPNPPATLVCTTPDQVTLSMSVPRKLEWLWQRQVSYTIAQAPLSPLYDNPIPPPGTYWVDAAVSTGNPLTIYGNWMPATTVSLGYEHVGTRFTPRLPVEVISFRKFGTFGTEMRLWRESDGAMLGLPQDVSGVITEVWAEYPLATPIILEAGVTYVVSIYDATAPDWPLLDAAPAWSWGSFPTASGCHGAGVVIPNTTDANYYPVEVGVVPTVVVTTTTPDYRHWSLYAYSLQLAAGYPETTLVDPLFEGPFADTIQLLEPITFTWIWRPQLKLAVVDSARYNLAHRAPPIPTQLYRGNPIDSPDPDIGITYWGEGTTINALVDSFTDVTNDLGGAYEHNYTRWLCSGWRLKALGCDTVRHGHDNNVSFVIACDESLFWTWDLQVQLRINPEFSGSPSGGGWYPPGSDVTACVDSVSDGASGVRGRLLGFTYKLDNNLGDLTTDGGSPADILTSYPYTYPLPAGMSTSLNRVCVGERLESFADLDVNWQTQYRIQVNHMGLPDAVNCQVSIESDIAVRAGDIIPIPVPSITYWIDEGANVTVHLPAPINCAACDLSSYNGMISTNIASGASVFNPRGACPNDWTTDETGGLRNPWQLTYLWGSNYAFVVTSNRTFGSEVTFSSAVLSAPTSSGGLGVFAFTADGQLHAGITATNYDGSSPVAYIGGGPTSAVERWICTGYRAEKVSGAGSEEIITGGDPYVFDWSCVDDECASVVLTWLWQRQWRLHVEDNPPGYVAGELRFGQPIVIESNSFGIRDTIEVEDGGNYWFNDGAMGWRVINVRNITAAGLPAGIRYRCDGAITTGDIMSGDRSGDAYVWQYNTLNGPTTIDIKWLAQFRYDQFSLYKYQSDEWLDTVGTPVVVASQPAYAPNAMTIYATSSFEGDIFNAAHVGVRFALNTPVQVLAFRKYGTLGTQMALWRSDGTLLATRAVPGGTMDSWTNYTLTTPITLSSMTDVYVISIYDPGSPDWPTTYDSPLSSWWYFNGVPGTSGSGTGFPAASDANYYLADVSVISLAEVSDSIPTWNTGRILSTPADYSLEDYDPLDQPPNGSLHGGGNWYDTLTSITVAITQPDAYRYDLDHANPIIYFVRYKGYGSVFDGGEDHIRFDLDKPTEMRYIWTEQVPVTFTNVTVNATAPFAVTCPISPAPNPPFCSWTESPTGFFTQQRTPGPFGHSVPGQLGTFGDENMWFSLGWNREVYTSPTHTFAVGYSNLVNPCYDQYGCDDNSFYLGYETHIAWRWKLQKKLAIVSVDPLDSATAVGNPIPGNGPSYHDAGTLPNVGVTVEPAWDGAGYVWYPDPLVLPGTRFGLDSVAFYEITVNLVDPLRRDTLRAIVYGGSEAPVIPIPNPVQWQVNVTQSPMHLIKFFWHREYKVTVTKVIYGDDDIQKDIYGNLIIRPTEAGSTDTVFTARHVAAPDLDSTWYTTLHDENFAWFKHGAGGPDPYTAITPLDDENGLGTIRFHFSHWSAEPAAGWGAFTTPSAVSTGFTLLGPVQLQANYDALYKVNVRVSVTDPVVQQNFNAGGDAVTVEYSYRGDMLTADVDDIGTSIWVDVYHDVTFHGTSQLGEVLDPPTTERRARVNGEMVVADTVINAEAANQEMLVDDYFHQYYVTYSAENATPGVGCAGGAEELAMMAGARVNYISFATSVGPAPVTLNAWTDENTAYFYDPYPNPVPVDATLRWMPHRSVSSTAPGPGTIALGIERNYPGGYWKQYNVFYRDPVNVVSLCDLYTIPHFPVAYSDRGVDATGSSGASYWSDCGTEYTYDIIVAGADVRFELTLPGNSGEVSQALLTTPPQPQGYQQYQAYFTLNGTGGDPTCFRVVQIETQTQLGIPTDGHVPPPLWIYSGTPANLWFDCGTTVRWSIMTDFNPPPTGSCEVYGTADIREFVVNQPGFAATITYGPIITEETATGLIYRAFYLMGVPLRPISGRYRYMGEPDSVVGDDFCMTCLDDPPTGCGNPNRDYRLQRYSDNDNGSYLVYRGGTPPALYVDYDNQQVATIFPVFKAGSGFFLLQDVLSDPAHSVTLDVKGIAYGENDMVWLNLHTGNGIARGMNMLANPYNGDVSWNSNNVRLFRGADGGAYVSASLHEAYDLGWGTYQYASTWDPVSRSYGQVPDGGTVKKWDGFWFMAEPGGSVDVDSIRLRFTQRVRAPFERPDPVRNINPAEWQLSIAMKGDIWSDSDVRLGLSPEASEATDWWDAVKVTIFPTEEDATGKDREIDHLLLSSLIPVPNDSILRLGYDYRPMPTGPVVWDMEAQNVGPRQNITLTWSTSNFNGYALPEGSVLTLVDLEHQVSTNMFENTSYTFRMEADGKARLTVILRLPTASLPIVEGNIPSSPELSPAIPNPFDHTTTFQIGIPSDLPAGTPIQVGIYNVEGAQVKLLSQTNMAPGWHEIRWDGTGSTGEVQRNGVYYCRLDVGGKQVLRRVVLLK